MSIWTETSSEAIERQVDISLFIIHIISGLCAWDFLLGVPMDWAVLRGRQGCRYGLIMFYGNCRYLAFASMITTLAFVDMYPQRFNEVLSFFCQFSALIAHGIAFCILAMRVIDIWRHYIATSILIFSQLAMWGIIFAGFARIPKVWMDKPSHVLIATALVCMSTELVVLGAIGILYKHKRGLPTTADPRRENVDGTRKRLARCTRMMYKQGMHFYLLTWIVQIPVAVVNYMAIDPSGILRFTVGYAGYSVTIICACKVFRDMIIFCSSCPAGEYCVIWQLCLKGYICGTRAQIYVQDQSAAAAGESIDDTRKKPELALISRNKSRGDVPVQSGKGQLPVEIALDTFSYSEGGKSSSLPNTTISDSASAGPSTEH